LQSISTALSAGTARVYRAAIRFARSPSSRAGNDHHGNSQFGLSQRSCAAVQERCWVDEALSGPRAEPAMTAIRFVLPLMAAHALLDEAVFARESSFGLGDSEIEFEDSDSADETRIGCSVLVAGLILDELRRIGTRSQHEVELSFALTEAAIIVRRAIAAHESQVL
jgi:hypothetical protein